MRGWSFWSSSEVHIIEFRSELPDKTSIVTFWRPGASSSV
ncbi:hypothetical protein R3I93_006816 [Phoxinus phoxinus]|uniref:Uncharacterized protein n=1 Tax=Phoxinus phoxinus TaxID=58324 RepID=A0AAN9HA26_9TELE